MKRIIACRPGCYSLPLARAMAELKAAGMENVEVNAPADDDYEGLARMAAVAGVRISSLSVGATLDKPERVAALERIIVGAASIGTRIIFLSARLSASGRKEGINVLRALAEKASRADVILSLETHPPFAHNGDVAMRTLQAINSSGIGYNFDTANIYYYNPGHIDAVEELRKVLPWVTSVHLKDSAKGEPGSLDFPVLGQGIVDFPAVFRLLDGRGFVGPYTLELEGPLVSGLTVSEVTERVKACLSYLKRLGVAD